MFSIGVASLPLTGLIGQYGYHPNHGCDLLRCNISPSGAMVPFYLIYIIGYGVPIIATLVTSTLIFRQFLCYCISIPNFCSNGPKNININDHLMFSVFIILYTFCGLTIICLASIISPPYSIEELVLIGLFLLIWYSLIIYVRFYIILSPKCKEMLLFLFRDICSVVIQSKSQSRTVSSVKKLSNCEVNSFT